MCRLGGGIDMRLLQGNVALICANMRPAVSPRWRGIMSYRKRGFHHLEKRNRRIDVGDSDIGMFQIGDYYVFLSPISRLQHLAARAYAPCAHHVLLRAMSYSF
jgi:hypothetical protein